ncbi:hypothetical protein [Moritella sp. JT01]|uniref:hypothetical protein n=1 Tax=Moritella sp. JT01 TaxID=756698 RepID=UPI00082E02BB|nr:hypothetical protein [Moritella sp. JT01]
MSNKQLLIDTICERMPWKVLQAILKSLDLPISKGVKFTRLKLLSLVEQDLFTDATEQSLFNLYCEYLRFGDKTVMFNKISPVSLDKLTKNLDCIPLDINPDLINYPYRDPSKESHLSSKHQLVDLAIIGDSIYFYFVALKSLTEHVRVDSDYLSSINANFTFPSYLHDISAKKIVEKRYYDIVCINTLEDTIEYRLDTASGLSSDELEDSFIKLKTAFINKVRNLPGLDKIKLHNFNLFNFVTAIYEHSMDRVCQLGFQVGSVTHHERTRASNKDLRKEVFHEAGKEKVKAIDVFRIAIRKNKKLKKVSYESELYLPGTVKMLIGASTATLNHAIISNCINEQDYRELVASMNACMTKIEETECA